jgi:GNAT superfamily N-acetyltransferase
MAKTPLPTIRALTVSEWEAFMQGEESAWVLFDIEISDGEFLVIERNGVFLAYLQHQPHESRYTWHVLNRLQTRPYYRRRGYARRLIEHVIQTSHATLIIARGVQTSSTGFWQRLGFLPDGYGPEIVQGSRYSEGNYVWEKEGENG